MAKITGVGGVFFKAKSDPKALAAWYELWEPKLWDDKNKRDA